MKRHRGQGHIFRRPGTKCLSIQYYVNGKRIRESTRQANRNQAVKILNERLNAVQNGQPVGPEVERTSAADLFEMLLNDYTANGNKSIRRVRFAWLHIRRFFPDATKARAITGDRVKAYIANRLEEGAKPATINQELAALRRAFNLAVDACRVTAKPKISLLTARNTRTGFFEAPQFQAVVDELPDYLKPVAQVAYATGWRVASELLTRQWHHVDFDAGWIRLEPGETKNGEGRDFPLMPELRSVLERQWERAQALSTPWVFHHNDGTPIKDFRTAWRSACRRAGLDGRLPHDFRRTAARNLERAGVPRSAAMKMTGHLTESIYRRYAIVDHSMILDAATKLAALHAGENRSYGMTPGQIERLAMEAEANQAVSPSLALGSSVAGQATNFAVQRN